MTASAVLPVHAATFVAPTWVQQIGVPGKAFVYPWGIATAIDGTILVGDYVNGNVKRFNTAGNFLGQFGSLGSGNGQFEQPNSVAVDPNDGSIYVSDPDRSQFQKWDKNGNWLFTVTLNLGYCYDAYLRVASNSNVYLECSHGGSSTEQFRVAVFSPQGVQGSVFGTNGSGPGQFNTPRGIDFDSAGNIYIADTGNHRVQVFDPNFNFRYQFGSAGMAPGKLGASVRGLVVDRAHGWVYVTDATNNTVHKFTLTGTWLGDIGTGGTDPGQYVGPRQSTVDSSGNLYVTDYAGWKVNVYDVNGNFLNQIPNPSIPAPLGGLNTPNGIALDNASHTLYVADTFNQRVQKFTMNGKVLFAWGTRTLPRTGPYNVNYPRGVAVDPANENVWLDDTRSGDVKEYDQNGTYISGFGSEGSSPPDPEPEFEWNWGITVGPGGTLYIADVKNLAIKVADQAGNVRLVIPCGVKPANFSVPSTGCLDVTVDSSGNIWAADGSENMVKEFSSTGVLLRQFGTASPGPSQIVLASGIALYNGRVYVSDLNGNRIDVFDTSGNPLGTFGAAGSKHGQFHGPKAIRIGADGKIYIVDGGNNRIEVYCCAA